jgi:solute:Na+ symporter, SSS family
MSISLTVFILYFIIIVLVGILVARNKKNTVEQYFLAGREVPWYAVGLSYIGSNISTEHFIGMVGAAYFYGILPANWEWLTVVSFTILIWLFLPYYYRSKLYTVPEFLERRFDFRTRFILSSMLIIQGVFVVLAGALYAGGKIINELFFQNIELFNTNPEYGLITGIIIIAAATGAYCVYGGLLSVIWTDVIQVIVMFIGAGIILFLANDKAGGLYSAINANIAASPARMSLLQPATNDFAPWTGIFSFWFTVCLWAVATKQYYVQRCLAAKSEWDARMGVIFAGFIKIILPFFVVIPGILAFAIYGEGMERDGVYLTLIKDLFPVGLQGLMLAAMASAVMSTISSVLNSSSTMFSLDIYRRFINKNSSENDLVKFGRWTTTTFLILATIWAPNIAKFGRGLFIYIQDMSAYIAAPIIVIFTLGILWKRATANAATATLIFGIVLSLLLKLLCVAFSGYTEASFYNIIIWLDSFLNRTFVSWVACMVFMIVLSYFTKPPEAQKTKGGIIWNWKYAVLPEAEKQTIPFYKSLELWTVILLISFFIVYSFISIKYYAMN